MTETNANQTETLLKSIQQQLAAGGAALDKFAPAFVKAWGSIGNVTKNANNPHFGSDYADLAAVLDAVKPAFAKNDLALIQAPGPMVGDKVTMTMLVLHSSGQRISFTTELPIGGKMTAQAAGSAHTYARRYQAQAIAGIAPVDDDGSAASEPPPKPEKEKPAEKTAKKADKKAAKEELAAEENAEEGETTYAQDRDALLLRISSVVVDKKTNKLSATATLEEMKEEIRAFNDDAVSVAYVEKRKEIRGSKS